MEPDAELPPESPPETPPGEPPESHRSKRGKVENLNRGLPKNVERGPDGKLVSKRGSGEGEPGPELSDESRPLLEVLEWVERTGPGRDRTEQEAHYRKLKTDDAWRFTTLLLQEREKAERRAEPVGMKPPGAKEVCPLCGREPDEIDDPKSEEIERLITELLEKEGADDAE
jgi:hypothetical protein